jgi:glycosyltransferase involved in cell wall biosynthesis
LPTKILFFISSLEQGGAERQIAELVRGLDLARFEPHVAVCNETDQLGYALPFASKTALRAPMGPEPRTLLRLIELLRTLRPALLHSYLGHQNIYGRIAVKLSGVGKALGSVRCTRLSSQYVRHEWMTHRLTDGLIVNSAGIRDELVARARLRPERIDIVENGVDGKRFRPLTVEERAAERARFGLGGTAIVVPGRISAQKNQIAIVRALAKLRSRGALPSDLTVFLAGRQEASTRYGTFLRGVIALHRLGDVVRFMGVIRDVERLVGAADAVLLPSKYEGLPNAVLEAMAAGTPVIVSPAANADALVRTSTSGRQSTCIGREGVALGGDDAQAIADGLERFLALSASDRTKMGQEGRAHTEARFTVETMVTRTQAVYDRLLGT